jgi:hypothetical protein
MARNIFVSVYTFLASIFKVVGPNLGCAFLSSSFCYGNIILLVIIYNVKIIACDFVLLPFMSTYRIESLPSSVLRLSMTAK